MKTRIYGLQRSGTNFLEYLINNNTELEYDSQQPGTISYSSAEPKICSLKHCKPVDDEEIDMYLIIVKNKENFKKSYDKWVGRGSVVTPERYDEAMVDYIEFKKSTLKPVIILSFENLLGNEENFLIHLEKEYGVDISILIDIPRRRTNNSGGLYQNGLQGVHFDKSELSKESDVDEEIYKHMLIL